MQQVGAQFVVSGEVVGQRPGARNAATWTRSPTTADCATDCCARCPPKCWPPRCPNAKAGSTASDCTDSSGAGAAACIAARRVTGDRRNPHAVDRLCAERTAVRAEGVRPAPPLSRTAACGTLNCSNTDGTSGSMTTARWWSGEMKPRTSSSRICTKGVAPRRRPCWRPTVSWVLSRLAVGSLGRNHCSLPADSCGDSPSSPSIPAVACECSSPARPDTWHPAPTPPPTPPQTWRPRSGRGLLGAGLKWSLTLDAVFG